MDTFIKQPSEIIDYTLSFADAVNDGDSLTSTHPPEITLELLTGTGAPPTLGTTTLNTAGNSIKQRVSGGEDGQVCLLTAKVSTLSGERLEGEVRLKIKEIR